MSWDAVGAMAGVAAAAAAAWQLWRLRIDALDARAAEIASVSVVTVIKHRPWESAVRDGRGDWTYDYILANPGRLPISDVEVTIDYPCDVRRRTGDVLEAPTRQLSFPAPVVAAHDTFVPRTRRVSVDHEHWEDLRKTRITVSFWTPDAGRCTTTWPGPQGATPSRALRRRLATALPSTASGTGALDGLPGPSSEVDVRNDEARRF